MLDTDELMLSFEKYVSTFSFKPKLDWTKVIKCGDGTFGQGTKLVDSILLSKGTIDMKKLCKDSARNDRNKDFEFIKEYFSIIAYLVIKGFLPMKTSELQIPKFLIVISDIAKTCKTVGEYVDKISDVDPIHLPVEEACKEFIYKCQGFQSRMQLGFSGGRHLRAIDQLSDGSSSLAKGFLSLSRDVKPVDVWNLCPMNSKCIQVKISNYSKKCEYELNDLFKVGEGENKMRKYGKGEKMVFSESDMIILKQVFSPHFNYLRL